MSLLDSRMGSYVLSLTAAAILGISPAQVYAKNGTRHTTPAEKRADIPDVPADMPTEDVPAIPLIPIPESVPDKIPAPTPEEEPLTPLVPVIRSISKVGVSPADASGNCDSIGECARIGKEKFNQGEYREAAESFKGAYNLSSSTPATPEMTSSRSVLLYNTARAYELAGDPGNARSFYDMFLDTNPQAEEAAAIRQRFESLDLFAQGIELYEQGNLTQSIKYLQRASTLLSSTNLSLCETLAQEYEGVLDLKHALQQYKTCVHTATASPRKERVLQKIRSLEVILPEDSGGIVLDITELTKDLQEERGTSHSTQTSATTPFLSRHPWSSLSGAAALTFFATGEGINLYESSQYDRLQRTGATGGQINALQGYRTFTQGAYIGAGIAAIIGMGLFVLETTPYLSPPAVDNNASKPPTLPALGEE